MEQGMPIEFGYVEAKTGYCIDFSISILEE